MLLKIILKEKVIFITLVEGIWFENEPVQEEQPTEYKSRINRKFFTEEVADINILEKINNNKRKQYKTVFKIVAELVDANSNVL